MLKMTRRREIVYDKGKPVEVIHLSGDSSLTAPLVVGMMKGVKLGHAGLGGTNAHNIKADTPRYSDSDVADRVRDHKVAEFRRHQIKSVFIVNNNDQATVLREQGNKFRHEHELCRTPAIESDFCVALERYIFPIPRYISRLHVITKTHRLFLDQRIFFGHHMASDKT
jgi:hypothetical protein